MPLPPGYEFTIKGQQAINYRDQPYDPPSKESIDADKQIDPTANWDWQNPQQTGPQGQALPELAQGWRPDGSADFGEGLQGWWKKAVSNVRSAWQTGYQNGLTISGIEKVAIKAEAQGTGANAEQQIKQAQEARKPQDQNAAYWTASLEATKEIFNQGLWGVLDGLSIPAQAAEQTIGAAGQTLGRVLGGEEVSAQTIKQDYDASKLAYSSIFDASIYQEMNRRLDAGMRPDLAAQDIMANSGKNTLWPELIGQIIIDPLTVVTAWGKAAKAARIERSVAKTFHEVANPQVAKLLSDLGEISKLDDATAYNRVKELVESQQALSAAASHADDIAEAGKDLNALSESYKIGSLTSSGKIAHLANQTGEILMHIVNNSSPDEALDILWGMVKSVDKDPAEAAKGVSAMLHFADPAALFSEAGNKTTVMLSKMSERYGAEWLNKLEELKGNPSLLTQDLMGKLDRVGEEMFPSVSTMLEAEKAVSTGQYVDKFADVERTRALAERAKQLPAYVRDATRFHDAAQKVVGPLNKFFIGAYMGWNPGFAFRNFSNNTAQLLIDYGPGVLLGKADDVFAKAEALHGGVLQGAQGFTQTADIIGNAAKAEGATDLKGIVQAVKGSTLAQGPAQKLASKFEENAAKRIIAKTYTQTFEKGTKAMVRALTPDLKAAGFSDDIIKKLPTYIMQNDGDASKIINALRNDVSSGVIDVFNDISRIDPQYKSFLSDAGKWDEYSSKVLSATTKEEAQTAAKKIFDDLAEAADYAYRDGQPAVDQYDKFLKMAEKSGLPETRGQLISLRKTQSRNAIQAAESILSEADDLGAQMGLQVGSMKKARGITGLNTWGNDAAKEADRLNDIAWKVTKEVKGKGANLNQLWFAYPELFPGNPPANLDGKTFLDALWHSYDNVTSKTWAGARDTAIGNVTGYLDDLEQAGAQIPKDWRDTIKTAQEGAQQFDEAMIGRNGWIVPETRMPFGSRTTQISQLAGQYGIETATAEGVATDKKTLAAINKYAGTSYSSLEDVPLDVAKEAFAKKSGQVTETVAQQATTKAAQPGKTLTDIVGQRHGDQVKALGWEQATQVPRSQLPEDVSNRIADEAKRMLNELFGGEPGKRINRMKIDPLAHPGDAPIVVGTSNVQWYRDLPKNMQSKPILDKALQKIIDDHGADKGVNVERLKAMIMENFKLGEPRSGTPPDLHVLQELGADEKTMQEALTNFNDITKQEVTLEEAIAQSGGPQVAPQAQDLHNPDLPYFDDAGNLVEPKGRILPPMTDGEAPTAARAIYEQRDEIGKMKKWILDDIEKNFGKKAVTDKLTEGALSRAEKELTQKLAETRLISSRVAQANRDFTLLNYGEKTYADHALAYLYPFHFWYGRTYSTWLSRIASNPSILGNYARYKQILSTVHAGMPDWWKYNINSNDLPGVDVQNPLYFNLEATLWPLNGLTNVDFNDPDKRVNFWTYALDYANKFGPSTWTPINMMTGLALYNQGQKEAGEKWMGRLFPQSNVIKATGSLLGVANLETDPFVKLLQGGLDPYERNRVGRALGQMEQDVKDGKLPYTQAQIEDAAYKQEGPIWDEAVKRAVNGRSGSQVSSFLFGVGFKGRTQQDMQIDKFYSDYHKLFMMRPNITTEEFRQGMDKLKDTYPFMDTVLLSRRDGTDRDTGLAYTVMTRIPPGQSSKIAKAAGIDPALLDKFYATKGALDTWSESDKQKFMSGILNIGAVLEIPTDMTRAEWTKAKNAYTGLTTEATQRFGKDIIDAADGYYQAKTVSPQAATAYLDKHPEVSQYMNWRSERIMGSPILSAYYGGASMIENYYRSKQYADIEAKLGKGIFDTISQYNELKTYGQGKEYKTFYAQHKAAIKQYYALKDQWNITINQNVAQLSAHLPEGQGAEIRQDLDTTNIGAQNLANSLQPQEQPTLEDFQNQIPERLMNLVNDYFQNGDRLPSAADKQLGRIAKDMGYQSTDDLLQAIGTSLYQSQP